MATIALETIPSEHAEKASCEELFAELGTSFKGLDSSEAAERLERCGPNALTEIKTSMIKQLLGYFWGPIPWMIEIAAILSICVGHWLDLAVISVLLIFNAAIGFWEEFKASNALDALKSSLALMAKALRDGSWQSLEAKDLVPGDVIRIRLGDVIPADVKLIQGDYLSVDQAALTGESLPVSKRVGDIAYSGSIAKQGEMVGLVTCTGENTFFGRTAKLTGEAGNISHFQQAVMRVGNFLIAVAVGLSILLTIVQLYRGDSFLELLQFVLILVIASIPVAMPTVLSVTMALGAMALSREKAIVSRLQAIEEIAGVDILCSDKTGTLTKNQLTLGEPILFAATDAQQCITAAALASNVANSDDAIDSVVIEAVEDRSSLEENHQKSFTPFDPISKRTESLVEDRYGNSVKYSKGAPQVILDLCELGEEERSRADGVINEMAAKGYRTLGVADSRPDGRWRFLGILTMYDPPRDDSAATIESARQHGIEVKMVTGDNRAIAVEVSRLLGLGTNIRLASEMFPEGSNPAHLDEESQRRIERADGFAEVFPEHKYGIVKALQARGHLIAMTGDGVNDAPALKQADIGIAVSGATDAARAAASLILTRPGLSVITTAIEEARKIFTRMMSYTVYRIAMTVNIMVFVVLAMLTYNFAPLTAAMIIMLALLDDIPIMTIAFDNAAISPGPVRWRMGRTLAAATILGLLSMVETIILFTIGWHFVHDPNWNAVYAMTGPQIQSAVFLQLVIGGHFLLFVTRSEKFFLKRPWPSWQLFWAIFATQIVAAVIVGFGLIVPKLPWINILYIWGYCFAWMFLLDGVKRIMTYMIENRARHHRKLLERANTVLHSHQMLVHQVK